MPEYNKKISQNVKLRDLTVDAYFSHILVAQKGLTEEEIIYNLTELSKNILDPIFDKFPDYLITSGFRKGEGKSQHNIGQACDIQWPGRKPKDYYPIFHFIRDNLPFDQMICEHGKSVWVHVTYNAFDPPRKSILTYHPNNDPKYTSELKIYY